MEPTPSRPDIVSALSQWLIGFFGAIFAFLFLPRTLKFFIRRFLAGIVIEIIGVVLAGLAAEKMTVWFTRQPRLPQPPSSLND
jgi:hypothetical protein